MTENISKDGTCPNCGFIVTSFLHYGFDGYPWTWCQNCHSYVKFEVNKDTLYYAYERKKELSNEMSRK